MYVRVLLKSEMGIHAGHWLKFSCCGKETVEIKAGRQARAFVSGNSPNTYKQVREFPVTLIRKVSVYSQ